MESELYAPIVATLRAAITAIKSLAETAEFRDQPPAEMFKVVSKPNTPVFARPGEDRQVDCNLDVAIYLHGIEKVSHLTFVVEAKLIGLRDLRHTGGEQLRRYLCAALMQQRASTLRGMLIGTDGFIMCTARRRGEGDDVEVRWNDDVAFEAASAQVIIIDKVLKACTERVRGLSGGPMAVTAPRALLNMDGRVAPRAAALDADANTTVTFNVLLRTVASGDQSSVALLAARADEATAAPRPGSVPSSMCVVKTVPSSLGRYIERETAVLRAVNAAVDARRVGFAAPARGLVTRTLLVRVLNMLATRTFVGFVLLDGELLLLDGRWLFDVCASTQYSFPRCIASCTTSSGGAKPWLAVVPRGRRLRAGSIGHVQMAQLVASLYTVHWCARCTHGDVRADNIMIYEGPLAQMLPDACATVDDMRAALAADDADSLMAAGSAMLIDFGCSLPIGASRQPVQRALARALTPAGCARDQARRSRSRAAGRPCRCASCGASRRNCRPSSRRTPTSGTRR